MLLTKLELWLFIYFGEETIDSDTFTILEVSSHRNTEKFPHRKLLLYFLQIDSR